MFQLPSGNIRFKAMVRLIVKNLLRNSTQILSLLLLITSAQRTGENDFGCHCMEYWTCVTSGGAAYSYCGLSASSVCCFVALNAKPVGILPFVKKGKTCGKKGADTDKDGYAEMSEWPWHVALLEGPDDLYLCGASLLDDRWILTAAHCVDEYTPFTAATGKLKVRMGEYDVSTVTEPLSHVERRISRVVLHPKFNNNTLENDIALLQIARPVKKKPNIEAVCMPKKNDFSPSKPHRCFITGWGRTNEASEHSVVLKEISVPLWKHSDCQDSLRQHFGPSYVLPRTAICAGSEGNDACDGDGGGPLVCESNGHWYQVGIVSFGIGCGRRNIPGVYTRVESYRNWIEKETGAHVFSHS